MISIDPDDDELRYGIDWDADGSINQWVPPSGYVASGSSQSASRTYSSSGAKTVKVMAQDEGGLSSAWAVTFSCVPTVSLCSDNADNDNDGLIDSQDPGCTATGGLNEAGTPPGSQSPPPTSQDAILNIRVIPSLVRSGNTTKVNWSASNVSSCNVSAPNGDSWTGLQSILGGNVSKPITAQTTYTLSCLTLDGRTLTKTATVRILPRFQEL